MEAKELRIGNIVGVEYEYETFNNGDEVCIQEGTDVRIERIDMAERGVFSIEYKGEDFIGTKEFDSKKEQDDFISAVPLTEEWLIKFGFVKFKGDESDFFKGDFEISLQSYSFWMGSLLPTIKYVHQLQNLYFALTNTELEIK